MALHASDERRPGRTIESGTRRLAEEIAGAIYVRLETGPGFNRILTGCRPMDRLSSIRIGVIAETRSLFDPAIQRHFRGVDDEQHRIPSEAIIKLAGRRIVMRHILYERGKMTKEGRAFLQEEQPDICIFYHTHRPNRLGLASRAPERLAELFSILLKYDRQPDDCVPEITTATVNRKVAKPTDQLREWKLFGKDHARMRTADFLPVCRKRQEVLAVECNQRSLLLRGKRELLVI